MVAVAIALRDAVVRRNRAGSAPRGAFTPAAAFGPGIAVEAGADFVDVS